MSGSWLQCSLVICSCLSGLGPAAAAAKGLPSETALAAELRVADAVAWAVARSPALAELRQQQLASGYDGQAANHLPDLQLKYEQWSVPLRRPWSLNDAGAVMVGLRQVIPPAGTLRARQQVEVAQVKALRGGEQQRRLQTVAQVEKAFAAYYRTDRQLALHKQHSSLVGRLLELARVAYQSGLRSQQDVVRMGLEFSRIHEELAQTEPELVAARAMMNTLMNRPVDAPLGPPAEVDAAALQTATSQPKRADAVRPELAVAQANVERGEAMVDVARKNARLPMFMVGLDYMYMPNDLYQHTYGAMVAVSLPWLNTSHSEEEKAASHRLAASQQALQEVGLMVRYEVRDAQMRMQSAHDAYEILQNDIVIAAQRNLETARTMYAAGKSDASALVDAARVSLEVQIDAIRSLSRMQEAAADLKYALAIDSDVATQEITP